MTPTTRKDDRMSMIEKAARALAGWAPNVTCWEDIGEKRGDGEKLQAIYRQRARAVIEALMQAPLEIKLIAAQSITPGMMAANANYDAACACLDAFFTAALNEGERE